jgi:hypothetical protein
MMEKLQPTIDEVHKMMDIDGLDEVAKKDLTKLVTDALSTKQYIDSIKNTIETILQDKKIDTGDISSMILLSLQVSNTLPRLLGLKNAVSTLQVKYIIYGSVYFYIKEYKPTFFAESGLTEDMFKIMFLGMWKLVELTPDSIELIKEKMSGLCGCC